ncbi:MAG: glycosyltransferase family 39 protein [Planctomycetes bacterium]|nr:glycosyltransferase family 39 protein [Planctomycetota bacterium]
MGVCQAIARIPTWGRWLLAAAIARGLVAALVPLTPEEAYHWNFAKHLDWSYHDHPPMIAWVIAAGCALFGDTALGIRFFPTLFAMGATAILACVSGRLYGERAPLWAVLLSWIQPITFLVGGAGFPDSPLLFFWALAMTVGWKAIESGGMGWWWAAGAVVGAGMLSKYTMCFFVPGVALYLVQSPRHRRCLATLGPYAAILGALVVFAPVLYWNHAHHWASLRYQSVERLEQGGGISAIEGAKFLLQQWLGVVPLTLPLAALAAWRARRSERAEERYLFWSFVPIFVFFLLVGCKRSTHLLWPLPGFLGLAVLMAGIVARGESAMGRFYLDQRLRLVAISAAAFLGLVAHVLFILPGLAPVKGLYGWEVAAERARVAHSSLPPGSFYLGIGRKYACASQMAFHLRAPHHVHGKHLIGEDGLQYANWVAPETLAGKDATIIVEGSDRSAKASAALRRYFREVRLEDEVVTLVRGRPFMFRVYRGFDYRPAASGDVPRPP